MAEINDLGDIQNGVEHISEVLDSMRAQNAMNAGDMDKVLANINSRLETLSNEENSDLIKVFLAELKRSLDERHNFVSSKFVEIESSFKNLVENAGQEIKADELRQVFDIIANSLNGFSKEVDAQKGLLTELNLKFEDLRQDDSSQKDILKNISVLKVEIEKFNNGFESIIVNLNDNFKEVSQTFSKIDPTGALESVKKDIENIFLSSNAVLSALQVIDRKNRELEEVLNKVVTKDDFVLERDQVANLISQNIQLTDYISKLPTQDLVDSLAKKVDNAIGVINALKGVLNETSDQNQKMLVAQLENLETKISNISSEEEFVGFKKELSNFAQEIIQSTNLMRADLMNTNSELQGLVSFLGAVDIKNTLEHFSGLAQIAEENIKVNLNEMSEKLLKETEQTRSLVANDVKSNLQNVEQKIDSAERNLVDASKSNFTNILDNVQSVLTNIFAMKNEIKAENLETSENLGTKLQDLRDDVLISKDTIIVSSQENLESLLEVIQTLSEQLEVAKDSVNNGSEVNLEKIISTVTKLSSDVASVKQVLSQASRENLENILSKFEQLSQELAFNRAAVMTTSQTQENFGNVLSNIDKISQEVSGAKDGLSQKSQENMENILSTVAQLSQELSSAKEGLSESSKENFDKIISLLANFSQEMPALKEGLNQSAQGNLEYILSNLNRISNEVSGVQRVLGQGSKENLESILSSVAQISHELSATKEVLNESSKGNFESILSLVEDFSQEISVLKEDLNISSQSNFDNIKEIADELSENLTTFKSEILLTAKSNANWLKSTVDGLSQELQLVKEALEGKSQVNFENITSRIEEMGTKIEEAHEFSNSNLSENISELKSSISSLPAFIQENQLIFEDEKRVLIEQNSKNIEDLVVKIQNLTKGIVSKDGPFKEEVLYEFANLTTMLTSVQEDLAQKNTQAADEIKTNIQRLESLVSQLSSGSEVSLYNLQTKLTEYLQLIQNTTQSSDLKLENSIQEVVEIKDKILSIKEGITALNSDDSLGELSVELNKKMDDILSNMTQLEESSSLKNQENMQETLKVLGEQFEAVKANLDEHKIVSSASSAEILQDLTEKITEIKEQVTGTNTNVVRILNARVGEIVGGFTPIKEAIEKLAEVDVTQIMGDLKTQLDESFTALTATIKENLAADKAEGFEKTSQLLSESFEALNTKIENLHNEMDIKGADSADDLKALLQGLSGELSGGIEQIVDSVRVGAENAVEKDFLNERFTEIETNILTSGQKNVKTLENTIKAVLEQLQDQTSISDKIEQILDSSKEEVFDKLNKLEATLILNQSDVQYSIMEKIESKLAEKTSLERDNFEELISLKADLLEGFSNAKNKDSSLLIDKIEELVSLKEELLEGIKNSTNELQQDNSDKIDYIKSEMESILNEVAKAQEGLSSYKIDIAELLKIKDEDAISQFSSIENTILEGISQNVEEFKTTVEATAQQIEDKISLSEENYKTSTQTLLSEIKSSFYSKVEENLDDLKSFMEVLEGRTDYNLSIDNLKSDVFEKFSILADDIEESVSSISVKKDLEALRVSVEASTNELLETLYDRIVLAIEDDKVTQEVLVKSQEIACRVEDVKRIVTEDFSEKLESFGLSIERQSTDFSNLISEIAVSLVELKENYIELSLNSSMEISSLLSNVQEKIDNISNKLESYDFSNIVESAKSQLMQEIASVKEGLSSINVAESLSEDFQVLNQKLDIMTIGSDDLESNISEIKDSIQQLDKLSKLDGVSEDFKTLNQKLDVINKSSDGFESDLNEIKSTIQSQSKFIEDLKSLDQLDKLSKLDGVAEIQSDIKKILIEFESKLNTIASQKVETKDESLVIKEDLKTFRKEFLESVLNIFDQISFVVEAEDIKDFVEEKSDEVKYFVEEQAEGIKSDINENIKATLGNNFNDILSSLDILHDKANGFGDGYSDIKNEIIDVKKHLLSLQNIPVDSSEYSYTFEDIESDIAKVRLILNELSQSKSDDSFDQLDMMDKLGRLNELDKLNGLDKLSGLDKLGDLDKMTEDIMSISNRTNKLLLTSDESYNNLKLNLDEFRNIVYNLEDKVKYLDTTAANNRIEKKIETVNELALSSVKSDKIFNQAFTYLAEWVDSASEDMAVINEKVSEIKDVKQSIAEIKKTFSKKTDLTAMLDEISDKFEQQQVKIERLEEKIDKLTSKKIQPSAEIDLKAIVAEVLAQVGSSTEKADPKMAKKVDAIDKQLTKLSKNIEKLASYVDQE